MLLQQNYGFWEPWTNPQRVTFDGDNKIIYVNYGVTEIDVKTDVYSAWKEWILDPEHFNSKYLPAVRSVGGDPLVGGQFLGSTFFLTNGWRMKTWEGDHRLIVIGNIFTDEGDPVFVPTPGYAIVIESQVSSLTTVAGTYPVVPSSTDVAEEVWASPNVPDIPTAVENADAVWNSASAPDVPNVDQIAHAVWEELMSGHTTLDSFGKRLKEILPTLWGVR